MWIYIVIRLFLENNSNVNRRLSEMIQGKHTVENILKSNEKESLSHSIGVRSK